MQHRPLRSRRDAAVALLLALALAASSCKPRRHKPAPIPQVAPFAIESEPNDSAFDANFLGSIYGGDRVRILGRMSSFDVYDGFAFVAGEPLTVSFVLRADDPFADFDVCIYDPYRDEFVTCFEAPGDVETGAFDVLDPGTEFHVVVTPFAGVADYELELVASCCLLAPAALGAEDDGDGRSVDAARSIRGLERLRAYTRAPVAEAAGDADDDEEVERVPAVLVELDAAGGVRAKAVALERREAPGAR